MDNMNKIKQIAKDVYRALGSGFEEVVYKLYGLTPEEIKIVENKAK